MADEPRLIFLHHGLFGFAVQVGKLRTRYFAGDIERVLSDRGRNIVTATQVHPTASIEERARQLKMQILTQCRTLGCRRGRVTIIAHSLGGLDARYMVRHLGMHDRVAAIVTVATPHRGSSFADWVFDNLGTKMRGIDVVRMLGLNMRAIADLRCEAMNAFNEATPDHPDVWYGSVATFQTSTRIAPFLLPCHGVMKKLEGDNDGVVSVKSAVWGQHLATWQCDHLHCVNRRFTPRTIIKAGDVSERYGELLAALPKRSS